MVMVARWDIEKEREEGDTIGVVIGVPNPTQKIQDKQERRGGGLKVDKKIVPHSIFKIEIHFLHCNINEPCKF